MVFERQNSGGKFVAWGEQNAKENSYVVEENSFIEGIVKELKPSDTYGRILELKCKNLDETIVIPLTTILSRELGYERDDEKNELPEDEQSVVIGGGKRVVVGDVIRIHFEGMVKTKHGKDAYKLWVEVDKEVKKK